MISRDACVSVCVVCAHMCAICAHLCRHVMKTDLDIGMFPSTALPHYFKIFYLSFSRITDMNTICLVPPSYFQTQRLSLSPGLRVWTMVWPASSRGSCLPLPDTLGWDYRCYISEHSLFCGCSGSHALEQALSPLSHLQSPRALSESGSHQVAQIVLKLETLLP